MLKVKKQKNEQIPPIMFLIKNISNKKIYKKETIFFREWNLYEVTEPILMFEESKVRYTKIKKTGGYCHE